MTTGPDAAAPLDAPPESLTGVVVSQQANFFYVKATGESAEVACSLRGRLKKEGETPCVGDRVLITLEPDAPTEKRLPPREGSLAMPTRDDQPPGVRRGAIESILPRRSLLERPTIANVDQLMLVFAAAQPEFNPYLLDKFLVLAHRSELAPLVVINKRDLVPQEDLREMVDAYARIGYPVVTTQASPGGVAELLPHLAGKLSVLAGPSGVGKSSILNAVQPGLALRASEVSVKLQRGRHTTRHAALFEIAAAEGALVADTPGFSFLEMEAIGPDQLGWYFPEMAPHIPDCKFPSCLHMHEPQCAVQAKATITEARYDSYLRILDELQAIARDQAERSSKEEAAVKRRSTGSGLESRLVKVDAADREGNRRTRNQKLATDWQEAEGEDEALDDPFASEDSEDFD